MRHLKILFILVSITFLIGLTSCKKESKFTSADVFVYEKGTNKPMVGIPVNFGYATSGVFSGWVVEQSKPTDVNGKVSFKAQKEDKSYSVGFPNGVDYFGDGADLKQGESNRIFLEAGLFAYVRVHAKNVNPYDNNDWIDIANGYLGGGGYTLWCKCRYYCCKRAI